jgi:ubiquinone/menaquinone biosynthesis C-methylase UbiE
MHERETARSHFGKRAERYDRSSNWVRDGALIARIRDWAETGPDSRVLDLATGTGALAESFRGRAGRIVGLDLCPDMTSRSSRPWDELVAGEAEKLPFPAGTFDACVCRQGLQFMDAPRAAAEILRVLKPGGRVVLCHLTAYGEADKETTFLVQRLRNPARRNFFMPEDVPGLLRAAGFQDVESCEYLSEESVGRWIDHGAISAQDMEAIRQAYRDSSEEFRRLHRVRFADGDIFDTMKFVLVRGRKA